MTETENKYFVCPKCNFKTQIANQFLQHLKETEEIHHPGNAYRILKEMVEKGQIKIEVA